MFRKTLTAMALGLVVAAGAAPDAKADVDISINLGYGGFYGNDISCRQAGWIVARRFNRVKLVNCVGRHYEYLGWRNNKGYVVKINSRTGRITDIRRYR